MQNSQAGQIADAAFQQGLPIITAELYNPKRPTSYPTTADISASVMAVETQGCELVAITPLSWGSFRRH